jgi:basic amino acid/polyamine antiporter, APA family
MELAKKKYGLFTALAMVVGIVIGSGVFKSAGDVLNKAGGNLTTAILAWVIGGAIIIVSTYTFSLVALKTTKSSGIIDFIEEIMGEKVAYMVGWFSTYIYFPALVGILAWLAGDITNSLLGLTNWTWTLGVIYFFGIYGLNLASPIISGKLQVSATVIKIIPLVLIALVGLVVGLFNGNVAESFQVSGTLTNGGVTGLAAAVAVTAFAYDGWITALNITHELKDEKKNLSRALIGGALIVVLLYVLFFVGLSGVITNDEAMSLAGSLDTSILAAERLFGSFFGTVVSVLILVSVIGTLNGLTLGAIRGGYQIGVKNIGPKPSFMTKLSKYDAPINSGLVSLGAGLFWGIIWYGNFQGYWGVFMDTSVLPIVFLYTAYIMVYIDVIKNYQELPVWKRYFVPALATFGGLYLIYGAFTSDPKAFLYYLAIVVVIMGVGYLFYNKKNN